ncbi:MAG: hypothetical protein ACLU38_05330 [Dysosmobacter sp.]
MSRLGYSGQRRATLTAAWRGICEAYAACRAVEAEGHLHPFRRVR